jgi:hypothetical protein
MHPQLSGAEFSVEPNQRERQDPLSILLEFTNEIPQDILLAIELHGYELAMSEPDFMLPPEPSRADRIIVHNLTVKMIPALYSFAEAHRQRRFAAKMNLMGVAEEPASPGDPGSDMATPGGTQEGDGIQE